MGRAPFIIVGGSASSPSLPVLSGLQTHFDAAALTMSNNDDVAGWADLSGNGYSATQSTASSHPTFNTGQLNGLPVVTFDGGDDTIETPAFSSALSQPNDFFFVGGLNATSAGAFFAGRSGSGNRLRHDGSEWEIYAGGSAITGGTVDTDAHYFTARFDGASSLLRIDGTQVASGDAGSNTLDGMTLGSNFNGTFPLDGFIAELVLFDRQLSDTERDEVEGYLASKWGL